ncbi:MAG: hypothetical protein Kow0073_09800 [Immundisolibacter sp.]
MTAPLIDSVVVVLREVLEFALLVGILLAAGARTGQSGGWLRAAVPGGLVGAGAFAAAMRPLSAWFGGVGYELTNAALHIAVYGLLLGCIGLLAKRHHSRPPAPFAWLAGCATAAAMTREVSEILLYLTAFAGRPQALPDLLLGSLLGAGVGFSLGALLYYLLCELPARSGRPVLLVLLALVGGSMGSQATALLVQADWLPARAPLWDSSAWLPEGSLPGQLLYALVGYEATPDPWRVSLTAASVALALALAAVTAHRSCAPSAP